MIKIDFKAFSFLQEKVRKCGTEPVCRLELPEGSTVRDLVLKLGLKAEDVEGAFVNGRTCEFEHQLKNGDRIALVPPGTPGPYRYMLGIRDNRDKD